MDLDGLCLRETEAGKIKGMHFQTFFGGTCLLLYVTYMIFVHLTSHLLQVMARIGLPLRIRELGLPISRGLLFVDCSIGHKASSHQIY